MKTPRHFALPFLLILTAGAVASLAQADDAHPASTAFDQVLGHYETVRLALTNDTTDGVTEKSKEIETVLEGLATDWSPAKAGVQADQAEEFRSLLPELREAAAALTDATSLETARDAFYELSKPLVRWRKATMQSARVGDGPTVAYCPMARRSWLQPAGEIGNPYHGQSMLRCGEIVDG